MPWSEWQPVSSPKSKAWFRSVILETRVGEGLGHVVLWPADGTMIYPYTEAFQGISVNHGREVDFTSTPEALDRLAYQFNTPEPSTWKNDFDWFPILLFSLEEGVDYGVRPDRTEDDDDAYVEYELDSCIFVENRPPLLNLTTLNDDFGGEEGTPEAAWELRAELNSTYVSEHDDPGITPEESWLLPTSLPGGSTFASGDSTSTVPHNYGPDLPVLTESTTSVTISVWLTAVSTNENFFAEFTPNVPTLRYQLPRWRYWIPGPVGILPLRQYPRNDGLKGGAPSARPTSRQATTARRTYL